MKYFDFLPKLNYKFQTGEYNVIDIFTKVGIKPNFYKDSSLYYEEFLNSAQTPEKLSFSKYGTFDYYWMLLIINNVYDVHKDWPYNQEQFDAFLNEQKQKSAFYLYENGQIQSNDILYLNETSYGVIDSWNPFSKKLTIKNNYNLPTTNLSSYTFKIRRINKNGTYTNLTNYCDSNSDDFTSFGYMPFLESPNKIVDSSGRFVNPFLKVTGGIVSSSELLLDTCDVTDKSQFQNSLIYQIVNGASISGVTILSEELELTKKYVDLLKINIVSPDLVGQFELKSKQLFLDSTVKFNSIFRIG